MQVLFNIAILLFWCSIATGCIAIVIGNTTSIDHNAIDLEAKHKILAADKEQEECDNE